MTSYSNISDILLELNNNNNNHNNNLNNNTNSNKDANGSNQKSCLALSNTSELEIKNLLKQIDSMINHKKLRWERQKQDLDNKLQLKEQEYKLLKDSINQKNSQIDELKKLINNMDKNTQQVMDKYEHEIHKLHEQLSKLKNDYIKMQRKNKTNKNKNNDKKRSSSSSSTSSCSSNNSNSSSSISSKTSCLVSKKNSNCLPSPLSMPELKRPSKTTFESTSSGVSSSTLNSASAQRFKAPLFKLNLPQKEEEEEEEQQQQQNQNQNQNNNQKDSSNEKIKNKNIKFSDLNFTIQNELNNKNNTKDLELEIIRLNRQLDEHKMKEIELYKEKDKLIKLNEYYKNSNQQLKTNLDNLLINTNNNMRIPINENDVNLHPQTDKSNIDFYKQELRKRDEYIKNLEALEKAGHIELQFYKDEVKKYKKQECLIKNEMEKLKKDYQDSMKRLLNIENENKLIKERARLNEDKLKNEEIIKYNHQEEKARHLKEVSNLKKEITSFTNQLTEKNSQIKLMQEQSSCLEKLLKEKEDQLSKTNQELIMTIAHLEALRLENHFLRQSLVEKKSDEKDILEMQKKYHNLIDLTENENKRLKNEVIALSECVESLKSSSSSTDNNNQNIIKSDKFNLNKNNDKSTDFDSKRINMLREEYEKQIQSLKNQHELSVKRLNNEIEKLYSEKHALLAELETTSTKNTINNNYKQNSQFLLRDITETKKNFFYDDQNAVKNHSDQIKNNNKNLSLSPNQGINNSNSSVTNSLSYGALSMSNNHISSTTSLIANSNNKIILNSNSNNIDKIQKPKSIKDNHNNKYKNQNLNEYKYNDQSISNLNSNDMNCLNNSNLQLKDLDESAQIVRRLSLTSKVQYDELKRKKELENLLENHIELLTKNTN